MSQFQHYVLFEIKWICGGHHGSAVARAGSPYTEANSPPAVVAGLTPSLYNRLRSVCPVFCHYLTVE